MNKKKFILIEINFNEPYKKLLTIKNKLGYLDGNLEIQENKDFSDDIESLPLELKEPITKLVDNYNSNKTPENYIKLKLFIDNNIYPKWTMKDLNYGELKYYDQVFKITDYNFDYFYIEVIYNNFRLSNYIIFKKVDNEQGRFKIWDANGIVYGDNLSYLKLLKKFMVSIKWLYFNKLIKEPSIFSKAIGLYNYIFNYVDKIGEEYNKWCIIKNKIDISKVKLKKYINKKNKYNTDRYNKFINHHQKIIDESTKKYLSNMNEINKNAKVVFNKVTENYTYYLSNYVRIY